MNLNEQITSKAKQNREEALSFEQSLKIEFDSLQEKSEENLEKLNEQIDLRNEAVELENEIANKVGVIAAMFSKTALLESLFNAKLDEKLSKFPKKSEEELNTPPPQTPEPPNKMAKGGIVPGQTKQERKEKQLQPYADTLVVSLQSSGIAALSVLGDFIKTSGSLGAFFKPYVDSLVKPFSIALGVSDSIINTLIGGPVQAATLDLNQQQKDFAETWGKFLGDENFVKQFIDRVSGDDPNKPPGYVPASWKDDPEFEAAINELCKKWGINTNHLLGLMAIETASKNINPKADNGTNAGLIQFSYGFIQNTAKMSVEEFKNLSRAQQIPYVDKYFQIFGLPKNPTAAQLYTLVFLPAFIPYATDRNVVLASSDGRNTTPIGNQFSKQEIIDWWEGNPALHGPVENDITVGDLEDKIKESVKNLGLSFAEGGELVSFQQRSSLIPYLVCGPDAGFNAVIRGMPVTLHGCEIVEETEDGFRVYPLKNKKYDITKDPMGVAQRWKDITNSSNVDHINQFASGGTADFWKVAALASKEDSLHAQGQADVAQALYNRAAIGSYPGGTSVGNIVTAPGQFEPTFHNAGAWAAIRDRKSAIAAAGNAQKVDMAAKSITNPSLQREAQKFIGGRTDFMGESQKPHMKPGDVTRGAGYNFHGWFYDAKLPKPAPVPKMIASQTQAVASSDKPQNKIIVNRIPGSSQPNIIQQVQGAISFIPNLIFNPHKLKKELGMRRAR